MNGLKELLHEGNHSLVIGNGKTYTFDGRGISDLYRLLKENPEILSGASVADKVVGKAAAALMILGGVRELSADVISTKAIGLLKKNSITVHFEKEVPHIINRAQTGWCPMEAATKDCASAEECLSEIEKVMKR